jgi:flagellar biosynthetic protein FliR
MTPEQLLSQMGIGEQQILAFFLVLARVSPLFALAPLFSSKSLPKRVRGIVAVALAVGLTPVVGFDTELPTDPFGLAGMIGKEILVGAAFSYTLAALFAALEVAGSFIDTLIGFSFGGLIDPGADQAFVSIFLGAIQVAGPIVLALTLTDAAFGVVSRVVPQLNVFGVGFPAKVTVGLLLLGVTLPFVGSWLGNELEQSVLQALQTLKVA